jgi:transmembrane sensor
MSKQDLLQELFGKFLDDKKMTPEEIRQLRALVQDERNRELLDQLLTSLYKAEPQEYPAAESNTRVAFEEVWAKLQGAAPVISSVPGSVKLPGNKWWKYAAAAMVILTFVAGAYWLFRGDTPEAFVQNDPQPKKDILPGGNKALLTLADGSTIELDEAKNGTLGRQGNTRVVKLANGQLAYEVAGNTPVAATLYNTITTPRGGMFHVTLPDGSRVWLNAASSLHYPTSFNGSAREVTLTGEAYFEVEKNTAMPFRVMVNNMQVEVLGTHFNVNAYTDEASIKTTLLEGSVKVGSRQLAAGNATQQSAILKPGQQAVIFQGSKKSPQIQVQAVEVDAVVAWKNGIIQFEGSEIHAAMRMIARWYDVEVEYRGNIPSAHFRGLIPSNVPVSQVLDMMELTGEVHFEISGRKIIVTP